MVTTLNFRRLDFKRQSSPDGRLSAQPKFDQKMRRNKMKFAIPLAEGVLCTHFGHCQEFAIIHTEDGEIKRKELHIPPPHEPGVLPRWLRELDGHPD